LAHPAGAQWETPRTLPTAGRKLYQQPCGNDVPKMQNGPTSPSILRLHGVCGLGQTVGRGPVRGGGAGHRGPTKKAARRKTVKPTGRAAGYLPTHPAESSPGARAGAVQRCENGMPRVSDMSAHTAGRVTVHINARARRPDSSSRPSAARARHRSRTA